MKTTLSFLFSLVVSTLLFAQNGETITVKGGEQLSSAVFQYEDFKKGNVMFKSGLRATPLMNYNMLTRTIQFKDESGTIMDIDNPDEVASISLNGCSYTYNDNTYTQYIEMYNDIALTKQVYLLLRDKLASSGYGGQSSTTSASSMSGTEQSVDYKLPLGETRVYEKRTAYFLTRNGRQTQLNQKNLIKLFPKQKAAITQHMSDNDIDLNDEQQVKQLLAFIISQ